MCITGGPQVPIPNLEKLIDKEWWVKHVKHQICMSASMVSIPVYICLCI